MLEASRFYINLFIESNQAEKNAKYERQTGLWLVIYRSMLFSKYSSTIKNLLIEKEYFKVYKTEMITVFYLVFETLNLYEYSLAKLLNTEEKILRKRMENVFTFSNFSTSESEILIDNFLSTKNLNEIVFYQKNKSDKIALSLLDITFI